MKKFVMEQAYLDIFPDSKIGILVCNGIDNHVKEEDKYADFLVCDSEWNLLQVWMGGRRIR